MPRFFFNLSSGDGDQDPDGTELHSLEAAKAAATEFVGRLLIDHPAEIWTDGRLVLNVCDEGGTVLLSLSVLAAESIALAAEPMPVPT